MLDNEDAFSPAKSPIYGETGVTLGYRTLDLLWRPVGIVVRFVIVRHPTRGSIFLMCTDLNLSPLDIIEVYGLRFKIEVSFKQALRVIGAFAYHFWMAAMTPIRRKSGNQHLHMKTEAYRDAVRRKLAAYHRHIQLGLIAGGLASDSIGSGSGIDLAILRLMDSNHPPRIGTLRTGRGYRAQKYAPGISRG